MIDLVAEILPPLIREDLVDAGLHHDCAQSDEIHAHARKQYPELFRPDDDPRYWTESSTKAHLPPPKTLRRLGWK
jgi:hypothetical protein